MEPISLSDLSSQETLRDPAAFYGRLREQEPLSPVSYGEMKIWVVSATYDETVEVLKSPRFVKVSKSGGAFQQFPQYGKILQIFSQNMLGADPPDHTRLRHLVSKAFTPRMIEQLRPRIQQITDDLLDAVQHQGKMEFVADFAYPLPITVISEMLGIPQKDHARFRLWSQTIMASGSDPGKVSALVSTGEQFLDYIKTLVDAKREHPENDLISSMIQAEESGDRLSESELLSTIWLLIVGGHETTVNLLSNGVLTLLQHPDQMKLLQNNASLIVPAVEELLRYVAPVLGLTRFAGEDMVMHGKNIHKGDLLRFSLSAPNTDPHQFTDPETLDITRQLNKHIAFGKGIHACLGAPLARLEGQVAIETVLRRMPDLRLAIEPEQIKWNPTLNVRGLESLPLTF